MLYTEFWNLAFLPFANDNRPETFVPTRNAGLCIGRLRYSLGMGMGASALFGEAGSGKTRLAKILLGEFQAARWLTAYLPGPGGGARAVLAALNPSLAAAAGTGSDGMVELRAFLADRARRSQPILLVVDDVQTAGGTDFLETLRMLLNIEADGARALSILLVGQAEMEKRLAAASGFDGQLSARAVLEAMTDEETRLYILARLNAAGSKQGIFTKQAAESVVRYSRGLPRQVNRLCDMSLVIAYGLGERKVTPAIVETAAADLDLLPPGAGALALWEPREEEPEAPADEDILAGLPPE